MIKKITLIVILLVIYSISTAFTVDFRYRLELASRAIYADDSFNLTLRAKPTLSSRTRLFENTLSASFQPILSLNRDLEFDFEVYRLWLRYSTISFDYRIGKQHFNLGPAQLLRSLRWFDLVDPEDFFEDTPGVNALSVRHFTGNTSIWLWLILSEAKIKGLEFYPSEEDQVEFGGRVDFPFLNGYIGLNTHYRPEIRHDILDSPDEYRFGLDGRWDFEAGFWFEAVSSFIGNGGDEEYSFLTLGSDYSRFGITATAEHQIITPVTFIDRDFFSARINQTSALTASHSLGVLDKLTGSVYYEHKTDDIAVIVSWQRTYDHLILNLGVFSYPNNPGSLYSGEGAVLTIQYNL